MNERIKTMLEARRQSMERTLGRPLDPAPTSEGPELTESEREHLHDAGTDLYWNELEWENLTDEERLEEGSLTELTFPGFLAFVRGLLLAQVMPDSLAPADPRPEAVLDLLVFLAGRVVELEEERDDPAAEDPERSAGELLLTDRLIDLVLCQLHGIDPADVEGPGESTIST